MMTECKICFLVEELSIAQHIFFFYIDVYVCSWSPINGIRLRLTLLFFLRRQLSMKNKSWDFLFLTHTFYRYESSLSFTLVKPTWWFFFFFSICSFFFLKLRSWSRNWQIFLFTSVDNVYRYKNHKGLHNYTYLYVKFLLPRIISVVGIMLVDLFVPISLVPIHFNYLGRYPVPIIIELFSEAPWSSSYGKWTVKYD